MQMRVYNRLTRGSVISLLVICLMITGGLGNRSETKKLVTNNNKLNQTNSTNSRIDYETSLLNSFPRVNRHYSIESSQQLSQDDFYQTMIWNHTNIEINSTTIIPFKSHIIIDSCNVSFLASDTDVYLEIGPLSVIEIYNSHFFRGPNSNGSCYFQTFGLFVLTISNSVFESCYIHLSTGGTINIFNSVFLNLGDSPEAQGLVIEESSVTIDNSEFINCSSGLYLEDCYSVTISSSNFDNNKDNGITGMFSGQITLSNNTFSSHEGSSIMFRYSNRIEIWFCQFYDNELAIEFQSCWDLLVQENIFKNFGLGIKIDNAPREFGRYGPAYIVENDFINGTSNGIFINGSNMLPPMPASSFSMGAITYANVFCIGNNITDVDTGIEFYGWTLVAENNTITNIRVGIQCGEIARIFFFPGANVTLANNRISHFEEYGIRLEDEWNVTFHITFNNISQSNGTGIYFRGKVGGTNHRASIVGNVINNTRIAIEGRTAEKISDLMDLYSGGMTGVDIFRNAFLNCERFIEFDHLLYPIESVMWNSDFVGNYWDGYNGTDEDHNLIGDNSFPISSDLGLIDEYPLLSLEMLSEELESTHPEDTAILDSELPKELSWAVNPSFNTTIEVFVNGTQVNHSYNNSITNITFTNNTKGLYNVTLALRSLIDNSTYLDTVWIEVNEEGSAETNDLLLPFLIVIAITGVSSPIAIWYLHPRIKRRLNKMGDSKSLDETEHPF